jgi:hypothetical protein
VSRYEERIAASDRLAARAEQLLAEQLKAQGRLPGTFTREEYIDALHAAQAEEQVEAEEPSSPPRDLVAAALVHNLIEKELAVDGRTLQDVDDPDEYVSLYTAAETTIYGAAR